jgi:flagellin-like protein
VSNQFSRRGVSSAVSVVLLVAVTVILAATVSVFALGVADDIDEAPPLVSESSGELVVQDGTTAGSSD